MSRHEVTVKAVVYSLILSVVPSLLVVFGTTVESGLHRLLLGAAMLTAALLMVPVAIFLTARTLQIRRPSRCVPWLVAILGPLALGAVCLLLVGPERRARLWWEPDAVDVLLDGIFAFGNAALLAVAAWLHTKRWDFRAIAWPVPALIAWVGVRFSTPHTDVIGNDLLHNVALFPLWAVALVPQFAVWVFAQDVAQPHPASAP